MTELVRFKAWIKTRNITETVIDQAEVKRFLFVTESVIGRIFFYIN